MNFKSLEKAAKLYEQVKKLDAQIIEIEKFALIVANNDTESSFELKCKDLTKKKEIEEKVEFDEDGSIVKKSEFTRISALYGIMPSLLSHTTDKKEDEIVIKSKLSVTNVMSILGLLLHDLQSKRQSIIDNLNNLQTT